MSLNNKWGQSMGPAGFSGHSIKSLNKYYAIYPLYGLIGTAMAMGLLMGIRALTKSPEVVLDHHHHTQPWNDYRDKGYKLIGPRKVHSEAPEW